MARHFQLRIDMFFKEIILDESLAKTKYYIIRAEFQVIDSPHIHSFIWIVNAPILSDKTIESYTEWVDQMTSAELSEEDSQPTLFKLVKNYQTLYIRSNLQVAQNGRLKMNPLYF